MALLACLVGVPAGALLGSVNGALVRSLAPPVAWAAAVVLGTLGGAVLPALLLCGPDDLGGLAALAAVCAGLGAEAQAYLLLRRARVSVGSGSRFLD